MSKTIASGVWLTRDLNTGARIDIIEMNDGTVRVRMVLRKGDNQAMYSDFFGTESQAFQWAEDITVAYGGLNLRGCPVCAEYMWPWERTELDSIDNECHYGCIQEVNYPVVEVCSLCSGTNGNHVEMRIGGACPIQKIENQFRKGVILASERDAKVAELESRYLGMNYPESKGDVIDEDNARRGEDAMHREGHTW